MMFLPRKKQQEAPPRCLRERGGAGEERQSILEIALVHGYEVCYLSKESKPTEEKVKAFILGRIFPIRLLCS